MATSESRVSTVPFEEVAPELSKCPTTQEVQDYLGGWCDPIQSVQIENHFGTCQECEAAFKDVEATPDTLMNSLQSTAIGPSEEQRTIEPPLPGAERIRAALDQARRLMDAPEDSAHHRGHLVGLPAAGQTLGAYELLQPLGHGGMGAVYLANHSQLEKQVAIKLLPGMAADNEDVRNRFQREIRVVGRLNHPAIVAATDAGEIDGTQFLVMEYVSGWDLSRVVRAVGRLSVPDACELMRQVALGLSCAHAEGVVHRDVKPSNVMLDESGSVRILDFGLAQLNFWNEASVELTTVGQLMGTLDYMAPEQAESCGAVDYRADLYAMGATLFRLLCGRAPLAAAPNQSPLEKLRLLANHVSPSLDVLCPDAPVELVSLVNSLLARHPGDRPASAAHVAEQLQAFTQSADLVTLLRRAREEESRAPESLTIGSVVQKSMPDAHVPADHGSDDGRRGRIGIWIATAFIVPLLVVLGVVIKLEMEKGQLVIDSEVADLSVKVVGNTDAADEFTIKPGATATRLRAGQYELLIDGPSDGVVIENQQFTIKNGNTVVARIRMESEKGAVAESSDIKQAVGVDPNAKLEPLFEGKPLSEWLSLLGRERSTDGLAKAFKACHALTTPDNAGQITAAILRVVPTLDGNRNLNTESNSRERSIDRYACDILRKANPGPKFQALWVSEIEKADDAWKQRLWTFHESGYLLDPVNSEPFVTWAEKLMHKPATGAPAADSDLIQAANALRLLAREAAGVGVPELGDRIVTALKSGPLEATWWLGQPLIYRVEESRTGQPAEDVDLWPAAMRDHMTKVAVDVLNNQSSDRSLLARACMILAHGSKISPEQRPFLLRVLNRHLELLCADGDALFESVDVNGEFAPLTLPKLRPRRRPLMVFSYRRSDARCYPILEFLDLVHALDGKDEIPEGYADVCRKMRPIGQYLKSDVLDAEQSARDSRGRGGFGALPPIQLNWPSLSSGDSRGSAATFLRTAVWGEYVPTPKDWLGLCIMEHPVIYEEPPEAPVPEE